MKLLSILLLTATFAPSTSFALFGPDQHALVDESAISVPGDNPLEVDL